MSCDSCRRCPSPTNYSSKPSTFCVRVSRHCRPLRSSTMTLTAAPAAKKTTYAPLELFDTDRLLDADERDIAGTVRKFVETRLKPNVEEWFESATLPKELAKEFGDLGVLGMHLDGYG